MYQKKNKTKLWRHTSEHARGLGNTDLEVIKKKQEI